MKTSTLNDRQDWERRPPAVESPFRIA